MFHTVVYSSTVAATAETDIAAVTDSIETIQNSHIVPQVDKQLIYKWAGGNTLLLRSKVTSPTIRQLSPIQIRPIDPNTAPSSRTPVCDFRNNPPTLKAFEEIQIQQVNSASTSSTNLAVLGLQVGGMQPAPQGMPIIMRGTGTTTVTAGQWTTTAITWADTLAQGTYAVVGFWPTSTTCIAARLIFDQQAMRPGTVGGASDTTIPNSMFLHGGLGQWGTFNAFRMPNVEYYCTAADTSQEVFLEFVRIA